nr:glycosyltransferase family 1 protein [uncultured Carboxylicivirga sp.]
MKKVNVTFFFRKPQPQYFSIEKVFEQIINNLPPEVEHHSYQLKTGTNGWWGRIKALVEVWRNKGAINHITGDITFIALALPRKGLVVTYHDLESLTQYKGWQLAILKYLWVKIPVRRAQVVTAISNHTKEQLIKWTGCDPVKIKVIHNPLPDKINYSPKEFNSECPHILVMGTKDNKNVEGVFEAVFQLKSRKVEKLKSLKVDEVEDRSPDSRPGKNKHHAPDTGHFKLIVVGKMTEQQKALEDEYQLDIENLIQVPYEQILDAYKRCDILCFPSFYEGFGLPIIEAQAIGRPVITSDVGSMKEVAGEGAFLVDPYKIDDLRLAISNSFENEGLRNILVEKGLENVKRFAVSMIARQYAEVYVSF